MQVSSQQILGVDRSSNACPDCESSTSSKSFSAYEPFKKKNAASDKPDERRFSDRMGL